MSDNVEIMVCSWQGILLLTSAARDPPLLIRTGIPCATNDTVPIEDATGKGSVTHDSSTGIDEKKRKNGEE